jgi:hypothetical protein
MPHLGDNVKSVLDGVKNIDRLVEYSGVMHQIRSGCIPHEYWLLVKHAWNAAPVLPFRASIGK